MLCDLLVAELYLLKFFASGNAHTKHNFSILFKEVRNFNYLPVFFQGQILTKSKLKKLNSF